MNNSIGIYPKAAKARRWVGALFLLFATFAIACTLSAQPRIVYQSFNSGFASNQSDGISIVSLIGQPFVGEASGNGISLRSGFGTLSSATTSVKAPLEQTPLVYTLSQNYPNPFNPSTVISFTLPEASHVSLHIFDLVGREISTLVNEDLKAGNYLRTFMADHLSSGVYFYRIVAAGKSGKGHLFVETRKFILIR